MRITIKIIQSHDWLTLPHAMPNRPSAQPPNRPSPPPSLQVPAAADHISIGRAVRDPKLHKNPEDQEVLFQRYRKGNKLWLLSEFARGKAAFALTPAVRWMWLGPWS